MAQQVTALARANRRAGRWFVLPAAVFLAVLLLLPSLQTILYSFFKVPANAKSMGTFVGVDNYSTVFGSPVFWRSVRVTLVFSVGFVVLSTVIGLAVAVLLNQRFFGRSVARALLVVPWATPWLVIGILWRWFADGSVGGLNALLTGSGLTSNYQEFLADPESAMVLTVLAAVWRQSCFAAILLLAGLQTLPPNLHEAAQLDGAGAWQRFVHITIPWLRPVLVTVTVLNVIYGFLQFDVIFAMTQGGPGDATQVLSILIYRQLFVATNIGLGSTLAVILGLVALIGGLLTVRLLYKTDKAEQR